MNNVPTMNHVIEEVERLLQSVGWATHEPAFLDGESVSVLLHPQPGNQQGRYDLPLTIVPAGIRTTELAGATVIMQQPDENGTIRYGTLNHRGQVLFRDLEQGQYKIEVRPRAARVDADPSWREKLAATMRPVVDVFLTPVIAKRVAGSWETAPADKWIAGPPDEELAPATERNRRQTFRNAEGWLEATVWKPEGGNLELDFAAPDRRWDGALVNFVWKPMDEQNDEGDRILFVPLAWSDAYEACVAEVDLGSAPEQFELHLPAQRWPATALNDELDTALRESVEQAATLHTRDAWRAFVTREEDLSPHIREVLVEALSG